MAQSMNSTVMGIFALIAVALPIGKTQTFEVASVKQNRSQDRPGMRVAGGRLTVTNLPLISFITQAYNLPPFSQRLSGGPDWIGSDHYDIEAVAEKDSLPADLPPLVRDERIRVMMQRLLSSRFQLKMRRETKEMPVYVLSVSKNGPRLTKARFEEKDCPQPGTPEESCHTFRGGQGQGLHAAAVNLSEVARAIENFSDRPVLDKTGLAGLYAIDTEGWVPLRPRPVPPPGTPPSAEDQAFADPARPTIFAVMDKLGLKLESQKSEVEIFVIDQISRPSEN